MPKTHKNKVPVPLWTVVATINTPMHSIFKLVAIWVKPITKQVQNYKRDSDYLIQELHQLGEIQSNDELFIADTVAMHPKLTLRKA